MTSRKAVSTENSNERGVVLIMVLWVIVFLGIITAEFSYSMRSQVQITSSYKEEAEAKALAEAGVALAMAEILKEYDYNILDENGDIIFKKNLNIESVDEAESIQKRKEISFGSGEINYSIIDEERKIDINSASKDIWQKLLKKAGVESETLRSTIIDSITDWRDSNSLHQLNGAEDDFYMSLPKPYHCKNGDFDSVEELLLIKGMTHEILYGTDKESGIYNYLTATKIGKPNINTASLFVLEAIFDELRAKEIINDRKDGKNKLNEKSLNFIINSQGKVGSIVKKIELICRKSGTTKKDISLSVLKWNDDFI